MTTNQIQYWRNQEEARHNQAQEEIARGELVNALKRTDIDQQRTASDVATGNVNRRVATLNTLGSIISGLVSVSPGGYARQLVSSLLGGILS